MSDDVDAQIAKAKAIVDAAGALGELDEVRAEPAEMVDDSALLDDDLNLTPAFRDAIGAIFKVSLLLCWRLRCVCVERAALRALTRLASASMRTATASGTTPSSTRFRNAAAGVRSRKPELRCRTHVLLTLAARARAQRR